MFLKILLCEKGLKAKGEDDTDTAFFSVNSQWKVPVLYKQLIAITPHIKNKFFYFPDTKLRHEESRSFAEKWEQKRLFGFLGFFLFVVVSFFFKEILVFR